MSQLLKGLNYVKYLNPVLDEFNNVIGLKRKVEQFLFPYELYSFMDLTSDEKGLNRINENFDKCFKDKITRFIKGGIMLMKNQ